MLKMKLPQRKSRQQEVGSLPGTLRREAVYEWFGLGLDPARRLEFACGLLGLCNPLELHFLSAFLEDLCRRDGPYLRETEGRVSGLLSEGLPPHREPQGDLCDPATRARLIVHLALLGDNREAAARLFRQLSVPVPVCETSRLQEREELLLVFTMASLHPAFGFHQRYTLRARLEQLRKTLEHGPPRTPSPPAQDHFAHCECMPRNANCLLECAKSLYDGPGSHRAQREAVHIEKIMLKGVPRQRADKRLEYTFKVTWSDHSETSVTKSHTDLQEFLLMLPKELSSEAFDKTILRALNQGSHKREDHIPNELETVLRRLCSSASRDFLLNGKVHNFFQSLSFDSFFSQDLQQHTLVHRKCTETCHFGSTSTDVTCPLDVDSLLQRKKDIEEIALSNGYQSKSQLATDVRNCPSNGIKQRTPSLHLTGTIKDKSLEIGSGHDTCGETSSESYSSPSSPRHERESLDSEEEKERGDFRFPKVH